MFPRPSFENFSDDQLLAELRRLAACERAATASLLASLIEMDARRLYLREGCSSLFTYCTQVLHLAEGAAYNRIEAARAARRFPPILDAIADGSLTLTSARLLAPHLTMENHQAVLDAARHKSKREIELLIATLHPRPPVATVVRKVSHAPGDVARKLDAISCSASPSVSAQSNSVQTAPVDSTPRSTTPATGHPTRGSASPLTRDNYRLQLTISAETHAKLRTAQDLLRHTIPDGDMAAVLDRALTLLISDLERRRCATVGKRRTKDVSNPDGRTRHIPAAVRREVWKRDQGRCAFTSDSRRCTETSFLEFHHVAPYSAGGLAVVENIQLRCRAHNQYEAELFFGERFLVREQPACYSAVR